MKTLEQDITTLDGINTVIAHVCNDIGMWGAGVSGAIGKKWPIAEIRFHQWYFHRNDPEGLREYNLPPFSLGNISYATLNSDNRFYACNMLAQRGVRSHKNLVPLNMDALEDCLFKLAQDCRESGLSVAMPKIGAGLGGGDWNEISVLINNVFDSYGVGVTIYDWNPSEQELHSRLSL